MCTSIKYKNKWIETCKDLAEEFGKENVVMYDGYIFEPNSFGCLCGVNVWKTGKANDLRVVEVGMGYAFGEEACNAFMKQEQYPDGTDRPLSFYRTEEPT